jgi:two-component sensor histidine kinase
VAVDALKAGAADYVGKTIGEEFFELLGSAIDQAMEKARLEREKARAEREVREARDHAQIMLGEVNHRVANSLALVATLVRMQAAALDDGPAKAALDETQARITAIAGIHRRLYTSDDVRFVEIDDYLKSLVEELETATQAAGNQHSTIQLKTDPITVSTDKAVAIGVIVTELVTNAFKYAYPTGEKGEVRVGLTLDGQSVAHLFVEDDGIGWHGEGKPTGTGLGSRVVKAMAANLGSTLQYDAARLGTRAVVQFSL